MLNIIKQVVYYALIKVFNKNIDKTFNWRLGSDHFRQAYVNEDPLYIVRKKPEKDWDLMRLNISNLNCEEPGLIATINYHIYYKTFMFLSIDWKMLCYFD